jgi:hypothetical protein
MTFHLQQGIDYNKQDQVWSRVSNNEFEQRPAMDYTAGPGERITFT